MHKITVKQNESELLNMLAAQRQIYADGKRMTMYMFIASVVLPLLVVFIKPILKNLNAIYLILNFTPIVCTIIAYLLKNNIARKKTIAATIQNRFDYILFGFSWDEKKQGDMSEIQAWIQKGLRKYMKSHSDMEIFRNWYPIDDSTIELEKSRILCQKCNVYWDVELKEKYKLLMTVTMAVLLVVVTIFAAVNYNATVFDFCMNVLLPAVPLFFFLYTTIVSISQDIDRLKNLKGQIVNVLELMGEPGIRSDVLTKQSEYMQSQIFEHRKSGALVLNFIYNLLKEQQESVSKNNATRDIFDISK